MIVNPPSDLCFQLNSVIVVGTQQTVAVNSLPPSLQQTLQVGCSPLDLSAVAGLIGVTTPPTQVGVSALPDGSRLAIRLEFMRQIIDGHVVTLSMSCL